METNTIFSLNISFNMSGFWRNNKSRIGYDGGNVWSIDIRDFGSSHIDNIPVIKKHDKPKFNQYKSSYTKHSCTITWAVIWLCYNNNIEFKEDYIREAIGFCEDNAWYDHHRWRDTNLAMQWVRKRAEIKRQKEFPYVRLRYNNEKSEEYFDKGYMVWFSFNGNTNYVIDYWAEGILDWTTFWARKRWHRTNMYKETWVYRVRDSEYWFKYNDYALANFHWLVEDGTYNAWLYIRTPEWSLVWTIEEVKRLKHMELLVDQNIKNNSELFNMTNDKNYQSRLHSTNDWHRSKISDIYKELAKYK